MTVFIYRESAYAWPTGQKSRLLFGGSWNENLSGRNWRTCWIWTYTVSMERFVFFKWPLKVCKVYGGMLLVRLLRYCVQFTLTAQLILIRAPISIAQLADLLRSPTCCIFQKQKLETSPLGWVFIAHILEISFRVYQTELSSSAFKAR